MIMKNVRGDAFLLVGAKPDIMKNGRGDAIFIMTISLLKVTEILVMFGYKFMDDNTVAESNLLNVSYQRCLTVKTRTIFQLNSNN